MERKFAEGIFKDYNNFLLDYEQVKEILQNMVIDGKISQEKSIGTTNAGFDIQCFSIGEGDIDIDFTGAMNGASLISTITCLKLMEHLSSEQGEEFRKRFKFHFVPVLNPEGYVISTSFAKKLINKGQLEEDATGLVKKYIEQHRYINSKDEGEEPIRAVKRMKELLGEYNSFDEMPKDVLEAKREELIENLSYYLPHIAMFYANESGEYDPEIARNAIETLDFIPDKGPEYEKLRAQLKATIQKQTFPIAIPFQEWRANGDGIDTQSGTKFDKFVRHVLALEADWNNKNMQPKKEGGGYSEEFKSAVYETYESTRYKNGSDCYMRNNISGPSGTGIDLDKGFKTPAEAEALMNLLDETEPAALDILMSAGKTVFSRRPNSEELIPNPERFARAIGNYVGASLIKEGINQVEDEDRAYSLDSQPVNTTSLNNLLTQFYPSTLTLLSPMGRNCIGPFGDPTNYFNVIDSSIQGVNLLCEHLIELQNYATLDNPAFKQDIIEGLYGCTTKATKRRYC